ncbi:prepilin-type N-terminal cleavage/methylation domain-containing protein [Photobacterium satsumensis]|uniref:prepilin-type N-terminal cleavage/methylation domain-containing protein n=1 Tax=Photobacterium satsumensis TaxID=2910239 RepID=UPI003D0FB022
MKKNNGFTLIELVVVIVILGIISVTAAPKFLNIQTDARIAALEGTKGALIGAYSIVLGKAINDGIETSYGVIEGDIKTVKGLPVMTKANVVKFMETDMNIIDSDGNNDEEGYQNERTSTVFFSNYEKGDTSFPEKACFLRATNIQFLGEMELELVTDEC